MTTPEIARWERMRAGLSGVLGAVVAAIALAFAAVLLLAAQVLAATEAPAPATASDPTLLIAGLGGAALAAAWLLKPARPRRPPRKPGQPPEGDPSDD